VIGNGLPVQIELWAGQLNDQPMAELLLNDLPADADVIADKGYDADWIRDLIEDQGCTPHIPPKSNRYDGITYSKTKYKRRNLIERCFCRLKQFIRRRQTGRALLQHLDDLLFGKSALAHIRLPKERTLPKIGDICGEQVNRNPLRQAGAKLPRFRMPRCHTCMVDLMSRDPSRG
jgi:transposase